MLSILYIEEVPVTYAKGLAITSELQNNVVAARAVTSMSQTQLADAAGVTRQTIAAIEKGSYAPSVTLALRIASVFEIPFNELFWLEETS